MAAHETKYPPPVHLEVVLTLPDREPRQFSYDFEQPVISLGRDPDNDIQIPLTTVSRQHARIFYEMGDFFLEDLGSTHGTDHGGRRLHKGEKRLLRDGDSISIMSFSIVFSTTAGTALDRKPGEKTEVLARRMVQEVLASLGDSKNEPPSLRVMNGSQEGSRYVLADDVVEAILGRSPECDFILHDPNASRRHCLVKRSWHGFSAQDLGSRNGVLVNGRRIDGPRMLKDGDEVQVGGVKLTFIDPASRLLAQLGGDDAEDDASDDVEERDEGLQDDEAEYGEDLLDGPEAELAPPEPEPVPDLAAGPLPVPSPNEAPPDVPSIRKGWLSETIVLVCGGLFFLMAAAATLVLLL